VSLGASTRSSRGLNARARQTLERLPGWWGWAALSVLLVAGGAVLVYETRSTLFWADEWQWILTRRGGGLDTLLRPHNEHFSLVPVLLYKLLLATVGLRHYWPYRGLLIVVELICAGLVFTYVRRRAGAVFGLCAAALLLFFGPGWQDTLWPFQTAWILTVLGGVGALLALDRRDRVGDLAACLLLLIALCSASPALAVAVGLVIDVLLTRRRRDLWIVLVPLVLYALWWLTYQQTTFNAHSILLLPRFVFDSAAGTLSSLTGLAQINPLDDAGDDLLSWGAPLLAIALAAGIWRLRTWRPIHPRVWSLGAVLLAFWVLTALGRAYVTVGPLVLTATGFESRYLYIGAVFMLLLAVELTSPRVAMTWVAGGLAVALTVAACVSNFGILQDAGQLLRTQAQYTEADLATMNLSRNLIAPNYVSNGFIFGGVTAGGWFAAERDLGSPPLSAGLLATLPESARLAADAQLVKIQNLALVPSPVARVRSTAAPTVAGASGGLASTGGGCLRFLPTAYTPPGAAHSLTVTVPASGLLVRSGTEPTAVGVMRFAAAPTSLGSLAPGTHATLRIRPDVSSVPWRAQLTSSGPFAVCGVSG
jgi:hypothetical protein